MRVIQGGHKCGETSSVESRMLTTEDSLWQAVANSLSGLCSHYGRTLWVVQQVEQIWNRSWFPRETQIVSCPFGSIG